MVEIKLNYNYGYEWYSIDDIYVKGYIYDHNDNLLKDDSLVNYFSEVNNEEDFKNKLINANGLFSIIIKKENIIGCFH